MKGLRKLRTTMKERGRRYTLSELADYMGVSVPTYLKYESQPDKLPYAMVKKLAAYFDVYPEEIIGEDVKKSLYKEEGSRK